MVLLLWKSIVCVYVVVIAVRWIDLRYNIAAIKTSPILLKTFILMQNPLLNSLAESFLENI